MTLRQGTETVARCRCNDKRGRKPCPVHDLSPETKAAIEAYHESAQYQLDQQEDADFGYAMGVDWD